MSQWWSYCRAQVPAHKRILNINLDESSVPVWLGGAAGTVVVRDSTGQRIPENRASASLSLKRGAVTLVAWICDNTTIQPFLPQIVLVSRALMSEEEWQVLFGMLRTLEHGTNFDVVQVEERASELMALEDPHEGLAAFMEKRDPVWSEA